MLRAISAAVLLLQALFPVASPGVDQLDAAARASGNRKAVAVQIGRALFATRWPAQVTNVYADGIAGHTVAGLRLSGAHFHGTMSRTQFAQEIVALVDRAFAAAPIEEVDVMAGVPLRVGKDVVVAGDLAVPTSRTVFTVSVRRGESAGSLFARILHGKGVYWDQEWAQSALK